ncbi:hypothetical protein ACFUOZ_05200 [Paenarthrobacter sp. NPDC057355]|jgi:predicted site-specific integrase-resolvase|uniref:hypothetical protein n=1 Tax=Paenarthrobacter sp. NPDC057355 TaxID=3346105 RepID=UPI0036264DCD
MKSLSNEARIVVPGQLIGAGTVSDILSIDRSTVSRWVASGKLVPLAQLDGARGAFVFDMNDLVKNAEDAS